MNETPPSAFRTHLALAGLMAAVCLFLGTGTLPLIDRDEPRFARATVEMMDRGDWVIPWFNESYRFDKPPLTYWLMRGGYSLLGQGEAGARLASVVSSIGIALLIGWWLRRRGETTAAWLAGLIWLTLLQVQLHGRLAVADMPLLLFLTLAQIALFELLNAQPSTPLWRWRLLLAGGWGLAFLAKGPLAYLIPLLTVVFYRWVFARTPLPWHQWRPLTCLALSLIPVAAWGVPALALTGGAFWNVGMGEHVIERGLDSFNSRSILPGYYFLTVFLSFLPWWAFAGCAIGNDRIHWRRTPLHAFLASWAAAPFFIFLFYKTQLPHYTLPAFPALSLLIALAASSGTFPHRAARTLFWSILALWWFLLAGLAVFFFGIPWPTERLPLLHFFGWLIACLTFLTFLPVCWQGRQGLRVRFLSYLVLGSGICFLMGTRALQEVSPTRTVGAIVPHLPEKRTLIAHGFTEPGLVFYSNASWQMISSPEKFVDAWERAPSGLAVHLAYEVPLFEWIISAWTGDEEPREKHTPIVIRNLPSRDDIEHRITIEGFNPARMSWSVLEVRVKGIKEIDADADDTPEDSLPPHPVRRPPQYPTSDAGSVPRVTTRH